MGSQVGGPSRRGGRPEPSAPAGTEPEVGAARSVRANPSYPVTSGLHGVLRDFGRSGVAAGLISIPNRYMHTQVEVVSLSDLEAIAKLIAETVARIDSKTSFIPR